MTKQIKNKIKEECITKNLEKNFFYFLFTYTLFDAGLLVYK